MRIYTSRYFVVAKGTGNQMATADANMSDASRYLERLKNAEKDASGYNAITSDLTGDLTHNLKVVGSNPTPATKLKARDANALAGFFAHQFA
jgi:hypothetical protein